MRTHWDYIFVSTFVCTLKKRERLSKKDVKITVHRFSCKRKVETYISTIYKRAYSESSKET